MEPGHSRQANSTLKSQILPPYARAVTEVYYNSITMGLHCWGQILTAAVSLQILRPFDKSYCNAVIASLPEMMRNEYLS